MNKLLFIGLMSLSYFSYAEEFDTTRSLDNHQLTLCASTNMRKMLFNIGDVALYLKDCSQASAETLTEQPVKLSFVYQRAFDGEDFIKSSDVLIQRNISVADYAAIEEELKAFNANYQAIAKDEVYEIAYSQETGLLLSKNGRQLSQSSSAQLAAAYFTIWFGDNPFSNKMKNELLSP